MIELSWVNKGIRRKRIFFYDNQKSEKNEKTDFLIFVEAKSKPKSGKYREVHTLITDLTQDKEVLFNNIDSQCRYEIRRAENKDNVEVKFAKSRDISDEDLKHFSDFYNSFSKQKKIDSVCDDTLLRIAKETDHLVITSAYNKEQSEEAFVYHVYIEDGEVCRLLYSCSLYREMDNAFRNLVGRANRLLHWKDMEHFKELGYKKMDWGGVSEREEIKNITAFKKSFGGTPAIYYNYYKSLTLKGKIVNFAIKIRNLFKK